MLSFTSLDTLLYSPRMDLAQLETSSLKADHLACVRSDIELFRDLSFELLPGQLVQIEGANGCGKTSLIRILCGLSRPAEGTVLWKNNEIEHCRGEYYADMAYVGHQNGLKGNLTCEENLQVSSIHNRFKKDVDIETILEQMGLAELIDEYAGKLSAGQQRRVALSRLLLTDAPLWILDEPFTALDHASRERMEGIFDTHCQAGGMVILTTHHHMTIPNTEVKLLKIDS